MLLPTLVHVSSDAYVSSPRKVDKLLTLNLQWVSDPLNSFWGRRGTVFVSGNFCLWSVIGSALVRTWPQLLVCRLLLGM